MPDDYVPQPDDPVGGPPILFRPSTFDRHARAVEIVEGANNARYPRAPRGRTTHASKGAWGYLATGHTITGASGLSLGGGTVQLCSRSGGTLTADGDNVDVLNCGSVIAGPKVLELDWTDGAWAVCLCSGECTIHVFACDGASNLVGASVTIKDADGTVLDTGTTDSNGLLITTAGCGSDRTIEVTAATPGYLTGTFTGQTLSPGITLPLSMGDSVDTENYVCCQGCPIPTTLHYSFTIVRGSGTTTGSGTVTYRPGSQDWSGFIGCSFGALVQIWSYDDPDSGAILCLVPASSVTCNPFNATFGTPTDADCANFEADTDIISSSWTFTA